VTQNQGVQHPAATTRTKLMEACELRKTRASGPGGQHRNKVETAIELVHLPSGISAAAAEFSWQYVCVLSRPQRSTRPRCGRNDVADRKLSAVIGIPTFRVCWLKP